MPSSSLSTEQTHSHGHFESGRSFSESDKKHNRSQPLQASLRKTEKPKSTSSGESEGVYRRVVVSQEEEKGDGKSSGDFDGRVGSTTWREQILYLFDIVASLCAGFNEHDIQFLSSLLALLRGDLSAQVEAKRGKRWTNTQIWKGTQKRMRKAKRREGGDGEKQRELSTESCFE